MSRIGNTPVEIDKAVTVQIADGTFLVKGPKGELKAAIPYGFSVKQENGQVIVEKQTTAKKSSALHGFLRAHIANLVTGVTKGWSKTLELSGVGYRAIMQGTSLLLTVGFSHQVTITPPQGITFAVVEGKIVVSGIDKQQVGQQAANIRAVKKPEPYKGKGIKYLGERIRKKAGKAAKAVGGAGGGK